jgi:plastocyanin domain-containing protein
MEFEATKCWLKTFDSNKVIVEVIQKRRLHKLARVVESLIVECSTKIKR